MDTVTDFNAARDALNLSDFGVTATNLAEHATQVGADVQIVVDGAGWRHADGGLDRRRSGRSVVREWAEGLRSGPLT